MRKLALLTLFGCLLALLILGPGDNHPPTPFPDDAPIAASGFHCIIARQTGGDLTLGQAAVLGSQDVEDEAHYGNGTYKVYWSDVDMGTVPEVYRPVLMKMLDGSGLPQWCNYDSETKLFSIGPLPDGEDAVEEAKKEIRRVRGAI